MDRYDALLQPGWTLDSVVSQRILNTKYRISETAMGLFLEEGYEQVTVDEVASAAQVSRRTVFRLFGGKDELPFPDHTERIHLVERRLASAADEDPVEAVISATEASLRDFLSRPELVLSRYQLIRLVPELREREVVEHERYVRRTRSYLRDHLSAESPSFLPMALSAAIDAMHRSALGNWARSGGKTDALAELEEGMDWIRRVTAHASTVPPPLLLAVLPDEPRTRHTISALKAMAQELP